MKKNAKDKVPRKGRKPFFAHLLEAQDLEQASGGRVSSSPPGPFTIKYPSDSDEKENIDITNKFPSDHEEGG